MCYKPKIKVTIVQFLSSVQKLAIKTLLYDSIFKPPQLKYIWSTAHKPFFRTSFSVKLLHVAVECKIVNVCSICNENHNFQKHASSIL